MVIQVEERSMKWLSLGTLIAINGVYSVAAAAEHRAASAAEVAALATKLQPGDVVILANGDWKDQAIVFSGKGTAERPNMFRAETPGKVVLSGRSSVVVDGEYVVVSGLLLKDGAGTGDGIAIKGRHCRLTETAVIGGTYKFFVHLFGVENRMDHCYLAEKTSESPTLQVEAPGEPNRHRIDHNLFGHRPPLGRNGGETMRVGYSHQSMNNSGTVVEDNLFDRCDGEIEIISSKSCENVYRRNTFLDCAGMLTLRHGNRCTVEGNFFIAHHKRGSGGIRVIGEDHTIVNNYIDGVEKGAFWITSGIPDSPLKGYCRARGCVIAFNTVVDSAGPYLDLSAGFGTSNRSLRPENITIANNVFVVASKETLIQGTDGDGFKWLGNFADGDIPLGGEYVGITVTDLKLTKAKDGLWRPAVDSPVRAAAEGSFRGIEIDIDGQPRKGRFDAGCDQLSHEPVTSQPLTAGDVGPEWMKSK
jgi:poly(beta-D-mannuronate) lyase